MTLAGKVAVVTGGTRGIGAVFVDALERAGATVAVVGRSASRFAADVGDADSVARVKEAIESELGTPQILVNAAGVFGPIEPLLRSDPSAWVETIRVDEIGPYLTCRAFAGGMVDAGWGRIVNVSSAASLHPPGPLGSAYATAKVALNQLTRHLASELEGTGVTANVMHPGDVKTDMWADIREQALALGPEGEGLRQWVDWVAETGGDPPQKAADLLLRIVESDVNGRFLWIDEPLQPPLPSWGEDGGLRPWNA
ncbi:MAG: SDR family oxidoreductase [Actinobacteria bacterium]|nr:SDR family oxidoreductase [Actinomycetota bacterium]